LASKVRLESRFPAVKKAAYEVVQKARDEALDEGEQTANQRIERGNASRGYNLPADVEQENIGHQSGRIFYEHFYGKWFEYGTVFIPAMTFMRPAHRKMRKKFQDVMGDDFEKFVRRRVHGVGR
jgi:HK97 gp10 family phage protein